SGDGTRAGWHLGGWAPVRATARFSADGSVLVFPRCRRLAPTECELFALDLAIPDPETGTGPRPTGIPLQDYFGRMAVSPDGSRVAIGGSRRLLVYRLRDGGLETAIRTGEVIRLRFLDRARLRFSHALWDEAPEPEIEELHLETGPDSRTHAVRKRLGSLPAAPNPKASHWLTDGDRLLYHTVAPPRLQIRSAATGELILDLLQTLDLEPDEQIRRALFLQDGRLALTFGRTPADRPGRSLWIVDPTTPESFQRLELGSYAEVLPRTELAPGLLLLEARSASGPESAPLGTGPRGAPTAEELGLPALEGWLTLELDLAAGELRPWAEGIVPSPFSAGEPAPGSGPSRHFLAGGHSLVRYRSEHLRPRSSEDFEILLRLFTHTTVDSPQLLD
ncbi:MAG: hypothetical protein MI919_05520, partial [Holophagales bacterium]|nr:hypothetical protein [Holophagales bacterium]